MECSLFFVFSRISSFSYSAPPSQCRHSAMSSHRSRSSEKSKCCQSPSSEITSFVGNSVSAYKKMAISTPAMANLVADGHPSVGINGIKASGAVAPASSRPRIQVGHLKESGRIVILTIQYTDRRHKWALITNPAPEEAETSAALRVQWIVVKTMRPPWPIRGEKSSAFHNRKQQGKNNI